MLYRIDKGWVFAAILLGVAGRAPGAGVEKAPRALNARIFSEYGNFIRDQREAGVPLENMIVQRELIDPAAQAARCAAARNLAPGCSGSLFPW